MKVYCIQKIRLTLQADSILSKRDYDQAERWAENVTENRSSWLELALKKVVK